MSVAESEEIGLKNSHAIALVIADVPVVAVIQNEDSFEQDISPTPDRFASTSQVLSITSKLNQFLFY